MAESKSRQSNEFAQDFHKAVIAQLGERQTEDLKVPGSIPGRGRFFLSLEAFLYLFSNFKICILF